VCWVMLAGLDVWFGLLAQRAMFNVVGSLSIARRTLSLNSMFFAAALLGSLALHSLFGWY
jgi:hypothetical protein